MPEAARTLVKSPPELWAEVSDPASLARHLGEAGEIRITRLDPEATVVWEGDRIRGTVDLAPAGWGTKVTVTAEPVVTEEEVVRAVEPPAEEPQAAEEPPGSGTPPRQATAEPAARGGIRGLFSRLFGRRDEPAAVDEPVAADEPAAVEAPVAADEPAGGKPPVAAASEPGSPPEPEPARVANLTGMLDSLGAAHHRPFSR
jgi:hypothetical protein